MPDDLLFNSILQSKWGDSRLLLQRSDARRLAQHTDNKGRTTLHMACWGDAPIDIVKSILGVHPQLSTRRDGFGWNPLNIACEKKWEDLVETILAVNPHAAAVADKNGRIPLQYALSGFLSISMIKRLLDIHPTSVYHYTADEYDGVCSVLHSFISCLQRKIKSFDSDLLYDNVYRLRIDVEIFSLMRMAYAYGTIERTETHKWLPLHEALRHKTVIPLPSVFILALLKIFSRMDCVQPDEEGCFLLHVLCKDSV